MARRPAAAASSGRPGSYGQAESQNRSTDLAQSDYPTPQSNDEAPSSSIDILGRRVKKLVSAINKLESLGIGNRFEIPLPKIVVVGDQSAGKSSQVEALSDIKVPRADGACTRCVLHISLKTSENPQWSCKVSVISNYWWNGRKDSKVESRENLGPWSQFSEPVVHEFAHLTDKVDLEVTMKRAQCALLNPSKDPLSFRNLDLENARILTNFSPNVVHLEITAPNLPNLSFYDLPGMIQQSEFEGESYLPQLIQTLAEIYISEKHTIVMLARPMTADASTSKSGSLVAELKAKARTIGVLTKPDGLAPGSNFTQWEKLIAGASSPMAVGHGYYVTKQPSQQQLDANITQAEARRLETEFFATHTTFSQRLVQHKHRFGTANLRNKLSQLLAQEISQALPAIRDTIDQKLQAIDARLLELPKPQADNSLAMISGLIERFSYDLRAGLAGDSRYDEMMDEDTLTSNWKKQVELLRKNIRETRPAVVIRDDEPEAQWESRVKTSREQPIDLDDDGDNVAPPSTSKKRGQPAGPQTPNKRTRVAMSSTPSSSNARPNPGLTFRLKVLRQNLRRMTTSNVADEVDSKAKERLMVKSMAHWEKFVADYTKDTLRLLHQLILRFLTEHLRCHAGTKLDVEMRKAAHEFLVTLGEDFRVHVQQALAIELHKPTTFNGEVRRWYQEKEYAFILQQRKWRRATQFLAYTEHKDEKSDEVKNRGEALAKDDTKYATLGEDPFRREIEIIADIRAYYFVAADSFVDSLAKMTEYHLFRACHDGLVGELVGALRIQSSGGFEYAKVLLAEDAAREEERVSLQQEREQLLKAQASLEEINAEDGAEGDSGAVLLEELPGDDDDDNDTVA